MTREMLREESLQQAELSKRSEVIPLLVDCCFSFPLAISAKMGIDACFQMKSATEKSRVVGLRKLITLVTFRLIKVVKTQEFSLHPHEPTTILTHYVS